MSSSLRSALASRLRRETGSAVLVTGIISMMFICLLFAVSLDVAKNTKIKIDQDTNGQRATAAAVKEVNAFGSLDEAAVEKMITEYLYQSRGSYYNNQLVATASDEYSDEALRHDENNAFRTSECSSRDIKLNNGAVIEKAQLPYVVVTLEGERKLGNTPAARFISVGGEEAELVSGEISQSVKYRVISAEIHDSAANMVFDIFGIPCQNMTSNVSAIAFGSQEDLGSEDWQNWSPDNYDWEWDEEEEP